MSFELALQWVGAGKDVRMKYANKIESEIGRNDGSILLGFQSSKVLM